MREGRKLTAGVRADANALGLRRAQSPRLERLDPFTQAMIESLSDTLKQYPTPVLDLDTTCIMEGLSRLSEEMNGVHGRMAEAAEAVRSAYIDARPGLLRAMEPLARLHSITGDLPTGASARQANRMVRRLGEVERRSLIPVEEWQARDHAEAQAWLSSGSTLAAPEVAIPELDVMPSLAAEPIVRPNPAGRRGLEGFDACHMPEAVDIFVKGYYLSRGGHGCHSIAAAIVELRGWTNSRNQAIRENRVLGASENAARRRLAKNIEKHLINKGLI